MLTPAARHLLHVRLSMASLIAYDESGRGCYDYSPAGQLNGSDPSQYEESCNGNARAETRDPVAIH
jgi:hypothetical protein